MTKDEVTELKQHIDQGFSILSARIDAQTARIDAQTVRIDEQTVRIDEQTVRIDAQAIRIEQQGTTLAARIDAQAAQIEHQGLSLGARIDAQGVMLRAEIVSSRREAGIVAEGLRSEIRQVAEGVALANERIDGVDLRVDRLATEMRRGFADVRAEIRRLHETDDRLAAADEDLASRVQRLESDRPA